MSDEQRFTDDEVSQILDLAAAVESPARQGAGGSGMSLSELQEIGAQVGIEPARIADAARAVTTRRTEPVPARILGVDHTVGRVVKIHRALTDDEWTRLVVDLRETFAATGKIEEHGLLRTWRNGNLQVHVEPDADGYRVRMRTVKGNAIVNAVGGGAFLALGTAIAAWTSAVAPGEVVPLIGAIGVAVTGIGQLAWVRTVLPRWGRTRAEQMEGLAERIPRLLDEGEQP